jgi:hypothetical protein
MLNFLLIVVFLVTVLIVAQMVEALCYKPEGRGFDFRWGLLIVFSAPNPSSRTMTVMETYGGMME